MHKKTLNRLFVSVLIFFFCLNASFVFPSGQQEVDGKAVDLLSDNQDNLISMIAGLNSDEKNVLNDIYSSIKESLLKKAQIDAENKFNLLPKILQESFLKQQRKFKDISIAITFENCIITLLNKIDLQLDMIQDVKREKEASKIKDILLSVYYFIDNGLITFLIRQGSLPSLHKKHEELGSFFYDYYDYNRIPFFLPFPRNSRNNAWLSKKDKNIKAFLTKKLRAFSQAIRKLKHNFSSQELSNLEKILDALADENLSKLIDSSLEYIQKEVDANYDGLTKAEKLFLHFEKKLSEQDNKEELKKEIQATRFFLTEIKTFKKTLMVFKSYKRDLKIQKGAWIQLFNNFLMASYDLYGKIDPFKYIFKDNSDRTFFNPYRFKFNVFSLKIWKNKFFSKYAWPDRAVRAMVSLTTFFDYSMAIKGLSLLDVMTGNSSLNSLGNDGVSLIDILSGNINLNKLILDGLSSREVSILLAFLKVCYIYKVVDTFSNNFWPLESLFNYIAVLTTYHFFDVAGNIDKVFWPSNDKRIKDVTLATLYRAKNSIAGLAELFLYITNPVLFENLENKTLGVLSPKLIELGLDLLYPDITNYIPESLANLKRDDRFLNYDDIKSLGLYKSFIQKSKNVDSNNIKILRKSLDTEGNSENRRFLINQIEKNTVYNREEYYEGKILWYLSSTIGGTVGRMIFESQGRRIGSYAFTGIKGVSSFLDAIVGSGLNKSLNEIESDFRETLVTFKEVLMILMSMQQDHRVAGIILYNLAGFGFLSYSDAAKFYLEIKKNINDLSAIAEHFDVLFDSIANHVWGKVGKFLGSMLLTWRTKAIVDKYGPFYPKIKNVFA